MENQKPTVAIVYHYFAHYRAPVLGELANSSKYEYRLISDVRAESSSIKVLGEEYFDSLARKNPSVHWIRVRNCFGGPLLWQCGLLKQVMRKDIHSVIFLGHAFYVSTWLAAILARMSGKRVFYWTHGIYGRESRPKLWFRLSFYRVASAGLFLYGNYAKKLLIEKGFSPDRLYNIFNSLDYRKQQKLREGLNRERAEQVKERLFGDKSHYPIAFFVGRLTPEKKLGLVIDAFLQLHAEGQKINLLLIGSGPVESELRERVPDEMKSHVKFFGACHDENLLAEMIYACDVCASPGNVGLTAIHSLVYGTPVVTHDDGRWQGPEFEAIQNGVSGTLFPRDELPALVSAMKKWLFVSNQQREDIRQQCFQIVDRIYNPVNQVRIIEQALDGVPAGQLTGQLDCE